jgi:hypothetical protein
MTVPSVHSNGGRLLAAALIDRKLQ